ncbi:MAG: helix-hairpin-helix domain-containing protein [Kiritimatiellia bacterium]
MKAALRFRMAGLFLMAAFAAVPVPAASPLVLQVFSNATLVADHPANDGDSFLVTAGGVRHHLRLYYADCPESRATQESDFKRVREQRRYFGLPGEARVIDFGRQASAFSRQALARPFVFHTAFVNALGRSQDKRYYAFIRTADGQDLAELLVRAGLARAYGMGRETPSGQAQNEYKAWMGDLEAAAMLKRRGVWAESDPDQIVALRAERRREDQELDTIRETLKAADSAGQPRINLNSAALEQLMDLPGVGEATARRIRDGRPWKSWEALDRLKGVGPATLAQWRERAVLE